MIMVIFCGKDVTIVLLIGFWCCEAFYSLTAKEMKSRTAGVLVGEFTMVIPVRRST